VIGGMIEENSSSGTYKVPLLGDIPLIGWLFKSQSKDADRTNLFVFITPRIIRNEKDAAAIHEDKKEYMRTIQEGTIKNTPARKTANSAVPEIMEVKATPPGGNALESAPVKDGVAAPTGAAAR